MFTQYQQEWRELESLVTLVHMGIRKASAAQLGRMDELYRRATIQLARAKTRGGDPELVSYLNSLTARAHSLIYVAPRTSLFAGLLMFLLIGFPRTIARYGRLHFASAVLFFGSAAFGYFATLHDRDALYALSQPDDPRQPGATREQLLDIIEGNRDSGHGELFQFASFLFQNNFRVGLLAILTGVLAGIPTVLILITNGLMLGPFLVIHQQQGLTAEILAWLLPHGIPELGAIVLSGGAGLMLGKSLLTPGKLSRADSLRLASRDVAKVAVGIGVMLFIAAIIESYVRQSHLSISGRFWFAGITGVMWTLYFVNGYLQESRWSQMQIASE